MNLWHLVLRLQLLVLGSLQLMQTLFLILNRSRNTWSLSLLSKVGHGFIERTEFELLSSNGLHEHKVVWAVCSQGFLKKVNLIGIQIPTIRELGLSHLLGIPNTLVNCQVRLSCRNDWQLLLADRRTVVVNNLPALSGSRRRVVAFRLSHVKSRISWRRHYWLRRLSYAILSHRWFIHISGSVHCIADLLVCCRHRSVFLKPTLTWVIQRLVLDLLLLLLTWFVRSTINRGKEVLLRRSVRW